MKSLTFTLIAVALAACGGSPTANLKTFHIEADVHVLKGSGGCNFSTGGTNGFATSDTRWLGGGMPDGVVAMRWTVQCDDTGEVRTITGWEPYDRPDEIPPLEWDSSFLNVGLYSIDTDGGLVPSRDAPGSIVADGDALVVTYSNITERHQLTLTDSEEWPYTDCDALGNFCGGGTSGWGW
jgi:hypothetical protein